MRSLASKYSEDVIFSGNRGVNLVFVLIIICSILFFGCEKSDGQFNDAGYDSKLELFDSVSLTLDNETSFEFLSVSVIADEDRDYLLSINKNINGFIIYDLETSKMISKVIVPTSGPGSARSIGGVSVRSLDSIYVFSGGSLSRIQLYDYRGVHLSSIRTKGLKEDTINGRRVSLFNHQSNTTAPSLYWKNKIYFTEYPRFDFYIKANISDDLRYEYALDLETNEFEVLDMGIPNWMQNRIWHMYYLLPGKAVDDIGRMVYSFLGTDSIYVNDNGKVKAYLAKHDEQKKQIKPYRGRVDRLKELEDGLESFLYTQIIFDPYRRVYYRIVSKPMPYREGRHKNYVAYYEKGTAIVVLDEDFKKISEFNLEEDVYRSYGLFVGREGLYVPRLHPKYTEFSEDRLDYSIYKLTR